MWVLWNTGARGRHRSMDGFLFHGLDKETSLPRGTSIRHRVLIGFKKCAISTTHLIIARNGAEMLLMKKGEVQGGRV